MYKITDEPIQTNDVVNAVIRPEAGAIVTFFGTVRELTAGKRTLYLQYEAYQSMAEKKLHQIGEEISQKWPDARTAIIHRIGRLEISDLAVAIAVSTPHRNDAYEANRYAIERIKEMVPIWKKEHWEDGQEWIGNQQGTKEYRSGKPEKGDLT
ncbi:molybdopterin synthase catalytic subunit [Oikeobacillus pervagus]|uniref:Molybdopterin synthase catalytic subunit n=1 Tax=Oikeobacillus pervagus TaxID=1325931 RepID=A0AAJ1WGP4_9BACI|nr:molybdenum cofactor biosynthesis protein MoaE [Oikeobacillus pervagus]MDQ0215312.1 molybdopterin synthase catalytic subunit [Oikeobacillus pervagus]